MTKRRFATTDNSPPLCSGCGGIVESVHSTEQLKPAVLDGNTVKNGREMKPPRQLYYSGNTFIPVCAKEKTPHYDCYYISLAR